MYKEQRQGRSCFLWGFKQKTQKRNRSGKDSPSVVRSKSHWRECVQAHCMSESLRSFTLRTWLRIFLMGSRRMLSKRRLSQGNSLGNNSLGWLRNCPRGGAVSQTYCNTAQRVPARSLLLATTTHCRRRPKITLGPGGRAPFSFRIPLAPATAKARHHAHLPKKICSRIKSQAMKLDWEVRGNRLITGKLLALTTHTLKYRGYRHVLVGSGCINRIPQTRWPKRLIFVFPGSGDQKFKVKVSSGLVSPEALPHLRIAASSLCLHWPFICVWNETEVLWYLSLFFFFLVTLFF